MKIQVYSSYENLSRAAAEEMVAQIERKANSVICTASGHSPLRACQIFVDIIRKKNVDVSRVVFVGLDEWLGISPDDIGSSETFFRKNIGEPLKIKKSNFHLFNALEINLQAACARMDEVIGELGGIDLMVVGIGINGHIGFNEPGVSFDLKSHVMQLAETTSQVGQKYFTEKKTLSTGITLGLAHLMEAGKVLLLADGKKKTEIVARALNGSVTNEVPASILLSHPNSIALLDRDAATGLKVRVESLG